MTLLEKFEARYIPEPNSGCWLWIGGARPAGYGTFYDGSKTIGAHQFSWMHHNGKDRVPPKMQVCHSCDNPSCVNPEHLWLGTRSENMLDASRKDRLQGRKHWNAEKTHCAKGHPYEGENLVIRSIGRTCLTCRKIYQAERKARKARGGK